MPRRDLGDVVLHLVDRDDGMKVAGRPSAPQVVLCTLYVRYVQNIRSHTNAAQAGARVLNVTTPLPSPAQGLLDDRLRRVIDDFGQIFARYGLALTIGRVFGLLLISDDPLSLDDIATLLGVSKSSTSVTARELERLGIVRRFAIPGSRRIVYELGDDLEPIFDSQLTRVRQQLAVLDRAEPLLMAGRARDRLHHMQELHEFAVRETEGMRERWRQRKDPP